MSNPVPPSRRELRDMNEALLVSSVRQHELTEQAQQAEKRLQESEERYRSLTQAMTSVVWTTGADGRFVTPQPSWSEFTGQTWEELRDFGWVNALHPDDRGRVRKLWETAREARTPYKSDGRLWHAASGGYRHFEARGVPILNPDGSVREWVGQYLDVEDRTRAEAAVEDSELRYRRLFETAQDAILILDARTGKITDANPYIQHVLGYSLAELVDKELWELGMFEDKEAIRSAFRQLQHEGYIRFDHLPLETKSGDKLEVEFVSNVYEVNHESVVQCHIRDITDRSRLERQTREQAEALADLHRRKDEFLAMLSHELRNPLAPITNAVHILRLQKNEDQLQQRAHTIIERQVGQLARLVDDLLEVSRITTGRVQLHQERVAMSGIVEHAVGAVRSLIDQRKHELTVSLPPQPIWLYADSARLEQVVVNLLRNAAKYTDAGGRIWLSLQQEGDEAVLRVRDTGVGIAAELLPRIFDLFTQAERSLDRSQGGLGIGLALVQRLVEMHHGRVQAHSALGEGSEFVVRLPVVGSAVPQSSSTHRETLGPAGPSLRVLVVDDNVDATQSLEMLLGLFRHQVRTAHDGPTALEAALDFRPNVVLLDIGLPGMDGYEVAEKMRQEPILDDVLLVALTGYGQESDLQRSLEAGFDHHLVKPTDLDKLQQILATASAKAA
jgi:PAS domain S-box-containing protein